MAERIRNMAGAAPTETSTLVIANASGVVTGEYRPQIAERARAKTLLKETAAQEQSTFQEASEIVSNVAKLSAAELSQFNTDHPGFVADSTRIFNETFRPQTDQEQKELERVLYFVRDDMQRIYTEAMQTAPRADPDSWYGSSPPKSEEDRLEVVDKALANYEERFWDYGEVTLRRIFGDNADIPALRQRYEGAASHLTSRVATAIRKEIKGIAFMPKDTEQKLIEMSVADRRSYFQSLPESLRTDNLGDLYLLDIKGELEATRGEREETRREQRRRATADERLHYNNYREKFDFSWAETPDELRDSVYDWLDYFAQQLPREAEDKVYESANTGLHNALGSLEQARNRIGLPADSVIAQELRETIEGHVAIIAGVRLLESKDGFDGFIKLRADYAKNETGHGDRVYLKEGSAIMADQLSEKDGEIYKGGPDDLTKPQSGDTKTFRGELERKAIHYAITHELYITKDDFERAELGEREIRQEVARMNLSLNEGRVVIKQRMEQRRVNRERGGRYGWEDGIEELLLLDSRGMFKARSLTDQQERAKAVAKVVARTGVFKKIKEMLDKEDDLFGKTLDERRDIIRQKIKDKMTEEGNTVLLHEIEALPDQVSKDRALWKWVENYNKPKLKSVREGSDDESWFPSLWDAERLKIDKPEGLVDRALEKDEFKAMVEEIEDPYKGLTPEQIQRQIRGEFRMGIQRAVEVKHLSPGESAKEFDRLMQVRQKDIDRRIEEVMFGRQQRETRAIRNFHINKAQDKFLGLEARWGGLTTRKINKEGKEKMVNIFSEARDMLKAKIDKEASDIEVKVNAWRARQNFTNLTAEQIEEQTIKQRRLFRRNATFAATLGLRELGIAHDLPIWNYYYYGDPSLIEAFAPLIGYTQDEKSTIVGVLERSRREMEAVFSFMAKQYMDGELLVIRGEKGLQIEDEDGTLRDFHEEQWVTPRVINTGGELKLRDLFEARFMISKSGGIKAPQLITKIADLGIYDELWENGCLDKREWQGFKKRRNKYELRQQSFLNIREMADPVAYVKRLAGAANARKFLVGGEVQGQGKIPGALNEPYNGLWRFRDEFLDVAKWIGSNLRELISRERILPKNPDMDRILKDEFNQRLTHVTSDPKTVKEFRAIVMKILNHPGISKHLGTIASDKMVAVGGEILKFMRDYMDNRDYVRNKAGYAPMNYQWDNELIARALFTEAEQSQPIIARKGDFNQLDEDGNPVYYLGGEIIADTGGEVLGGDHLAYAPEGRTGLANYLFMAILRASSYHIVDAQTIRALEGRAKITKKKMDDKRTDLMAEILPVTALGAIDAEKEILKQHDQSVKQIIQEFAKISIEEKDTHGVRVEYGQKLQTASTQRRNSQVNIARLTNQAIEAELDAQFNAGNLTNQILRTMIAGRRAELARLGADPLRGNIELEISRLINQYVDERLHKEFVGEWSTRLLAA